MIVVVDGSCQPNPGKGAYQGFDITKGIDKKELMFRYDIPGNTTNNVAEYLAIVHAMGILIKLNVKEPIIFSDSQTAICWVQKGMHNSNTALLDQESIDLLNRADRFLQNTPIAKFNTVTQVKFWSKKILGVENPADFGNKY